MLTRLFIAALLLGSTGCFHARTAAHNLKVGGRNNERSLNVEVYRYIGASGPVNLLLEDSRGVRCDVRFDALRFPLFRDQAELNLSSEETEVLKQAALTALRDYFGAPKEIYIKTLIVVNSESRETYLLDAYTTAPGDTLAEHLLKRGLVLADRELLRVHRETRYLLDVQDEARSARLGIWKNIFSPNPNWP